MLETNLILNPVSERRPKEPWPASTRNTGVPRARLVKPFEVCKHGDNGSSSVERSDEGTSRISKANSFGNSGTRLDDHETLLRAVKGRTKHYGLSNNARRAHQNRVVCVCTYERPTVPDHPYERFVGHGRQTALKRHGNAGRILPQKQHCYIPLICCLYLWIVAIKPRHGKLSIWLRVIRSEAKRHWNFIHSCTALGYKAVFRGEYNPPRNQRPRTSLAHSG